MPSGYPTWLTWQRRPFPDANLLLVHGRQPALVDSGFVGHARETVESGACARRAARAGREHALALRPRRRERAAAAGGRGDRRQRRGRRGRRSAQPGLLPSRYLDQPVSPSTVDERLDDGQVVRLGDADWQIAAPPDTPPVTCRCGTPTSGCWPSGTRCRTTTSAG